METLEKYNSQKENVMNCGVAKLVFVVASDDAHKLVLSFLLQNFSRTFFVSLKIGTKKKTIEQLIIIITKCGSTFQKFISSLVNICFFFSFWYVVLRPANHQQPIDKVSN